MVALSLIVHGVFLYGVRMKKNDLEVMPPIALRATIALKAAPMPEPNAAAPTESIKKTPNEKIKIPPRKVAKSKPKKAVEEKSLPVDAVPEPISKAVLPEPAPAMAPSPIPDTNFATADRSPPLPPPASALERSGAKVRAPTPIENPTMPADDVVAVAPKMIEEEAPAPMPAIATAPHPIEPVAQDEPPRVEPPPIMSNAEPTEPLPLSTKPSEIPREAPAPSATNENIATVPPPEIVAAPPIAIDPNALPLPASGEAQYKLRMGLVSGELTLSWKFADGHYRLDSIAQGSGIFAIAGKYIQVSEGDIATSGLRPATFSVERRGRKESAAFNWSENSVRFSGKSGERTEAATPGTQDMLSLLFQLAFAPPLGSDLTVIVTNGRKLERYAFERAGEEMISLEGGKFNTLKILKQRKGDDDGMEVWLALEHHYLPVKIRVTDKKGSVIEQTLMAIKVVSAN